MAGKKTSGSDQRGKVINHNYSARTYKTEGYANFTEFYPFYLGEHCNKINRRLHLFSTTNGILIWLFALLTSTYYIIPLAFVQGYALAWVGHFVFEQNKPATFKHPIYSLMGDFRMWYEVVTGLRSF